MATAPSIHVSPERDWVTADHLGSGGAPAAAMLIMWSAESRKAKTEPALAVGFQNKLPMVSI